MELVWAINLVLLLLSVLSVVADWYTEKRDLFSFNTMFLGGMCMFYYLPMVVAPFIDPNLLVFPYFPRYDQNGLVALSLILFNVLYFVGRHFSAKWSWPDRIAPGFRDIPVNAVALLTITLGALTAGVFIYLFLFRAGGEVNVFEAFIIGLIPTVTAFAAGVATVLVLRQPLNAMWYALLAIVFFVALLASISFSNDRRYALCVLLIIPWMLYWGKLRYRPKVLTVTTSIVGAILAGSFILFYSAFRHNLDTKGEVVFQRINQLGTSDASKAFSADGLLSIVVQDSAFNSIYFVENVPEITPYQPLQGLWFYVTNPIPRTIFPDKPIGLGIQLQVLVGSPANLGTGILGHGWAEAGLIGVGYYGLFFGGLVGILDSLLRRRKGNPYFIAILGSCAGNFIGVPRGETSLFMVLITYGSVGTYAIVWGINKLLGPLARAGNDFQFGEPEMHELEAEGDALAESYGEQHDTVPAQGQEHPGTPAPAR